MGQYEQKYSFTDTSGQPVYSKYTLYCVVLINKIKMIFLQNITLMNVYCNVADMH